MISFYFIVNITVHQNNIIPVNITISFISFYLEIYAKKRLHILPMYEFNYFTRQYRAVAQLCYNFAQSHICCLR